MHLVSLSKSVSEGFYSHFIVNNILEGMIWFWVPASLVICNDIFAYIWGMAVGRTPLIKLSPKKTVEGFVGAFWSTLLFSVIWGSYFMRFNYMICPVRDLGVAAWNNVQCTPNPVFVWREWQIWSPLRVFLSQLVSDNLCYLCQCLRVDISSENQSP
jgi:phosphatidate cytidylyltransferase